MGALMESGRRKIANEFLQVAGQNSGTVQVTRIRRRQPTEIFQVKDFQPQEEDKRYKK